jgi:hypothetical protein
VQFVDLSATVLNLAGVPLPEGIDGRPFMGNGVSLQELNNRDTAFGYADRFDEKYDLVRTIRKGRFQYIRNYQPFNVDALYNRYRYLQPAYKELLELYKEGRLNDDQRRFFEIRPAECLYDLVSDPHEVNNLAGDPAYAGVLSELRDALRARVKSMPDLSFIPEPVFLEEGSENPVAYGQTSKALIGRLVDIADLEMRPFEEAKDRIAEALASNDANERYWGLIVCTAFGDQAALFFEVAQKMSGEDESNLVRVRAAEFLGLTGADDPRPAILAALERSEDPFEIGLMLNSVTLLTDYGSGYDFDLTGFLKKASGTPLVKTDCVTRRLEYLTGE